MMKKELSIKIDYLSIIFEPLQAEELIRRVLHLPIEYFMIQKAKVKHKDYTRLYQFGTIKVYGDRQLKDGTHEAGSYLVLSGQGCDDYYSFLQTTNSAYNSFFDTCIQIVGKDQFHLTRLDIAIDDKNETHTLRTANCLPGFLEILTGMKVDFHLLQYRMKGSDTGIIVDMPIIADA